MTHLIEEGVKGIGIKRERVIEELKGGDFSSESWGGKDIIRYKNWRCQRHHWELHHVKELASLGCQSDNNSKGLCIRQLQSS
jgi:hypothetical protein